MSKPDYCPISVWASFTRHIDCLVCDKNSIPQECKIKIEKQEKLIEKGLIKAYLTVDKDGKESIFLGKPPVRYNDRWILDKDDIGEAFDLQKGIVRKFIRRELKWEDEPAEIYVNY